MTHGHTNQLLDSLPPDIRIPLLAQMEEIVLPVPTPIYRPGEVPRFAHFMTSGITSVVSYMKDGDGVEVGLCGRESLVEAFHLLGSAAIPTTAFIQVDGTALRMPFSDLRREFNASEPLRAHILRFIQAQSLILGQIAACNRLHEVDQRLARWLLMVSDRVEATRFYITQEFLAEMIGASRTTVTLAAGALQRNNLIEYARGAIHILDREGLEAAACECYPIVRGLIANLYAV